MKNSEFRKVYDARNSYANKYLVMYVLREERKENNLGISVSKKVGNSVVRHRTTRLIRESYRLNKEKFNSGLNLVVIARDGAKGKSLKEIESAFLHLSKKHGLLRETKKC